METEEAVDLWLLAKALKKNGTPDSTIVKILQLYHARGRASSH